MVPEVVGNPVRIFTPAERIELRVLEFFVKQLPLPDRVPIVFYVVDEQCGNFEAPKALDVSADWSFLNHNLAECWLLLYGVENRSSALRMSHEYKVVVVL